MMNRRRQRCIVVKVATGGTEGMMLVRVRGEKAHREGAATERARRWGVRRGTLVETTVALVTIAVLISAAVREQPMSGTRLTPTARFPVMERNVFCMTSPGDTLSLACVFASV